MKVWKYGVVAALVAAAGDAGAQPAGTTIREEQRFPLDRLRMALDTEGVVNVEAASLPVRYSWDMLFWVGTENDPLVLNRGADRLGALVSQRVDGALAGSAVLLPWLQLGVDLPVILYQTRDSTIEGVSTTLPEIGGFGLGDIRLQGKARLLQASRSGVDLAFLLGATLPTGTNRNYFVEGSSTLLPGLAVGRAHPSGLRWSANALYRVREDQQLLAMRVADEIELRAGAAYRFEARGGPPLEVGLSAMLGTAAAAPFQEATSDPAEGIAQVSYHLKKHGAMLFAGVGAGIREGFGVPDWRVFVGLRPFERDRDRDGDGLLDSVDLCPTDPEDKDEFQDTDGCPDPDDDGDGVLDVHDRCPREPEDKDEFQDTDGCPDPDNDSDGIPDVKDRCPVMAEDRDGFDDADGCPDPDNDGDGVLDTVDRCPSDPEDRDGFEDQDGCVEPDNDGDGVLDVDDRCPLDRGDAKHVGCTDVAPIKDKIDLIGKVNFQTNKAILLPTSFRVLDAVIDVLRAHPELALVRVEGHTDARGSQKRNTRLSQERSEAVLAYLVRKGIDRTRLMPQGYGPTRPVASNASDEGREKNRRVEFTIVKRVTGEAVAGGPPAGVTVSKTFGGVQNQRGALLAPTREGLELLRGERMHLQPSARATLAVAGGGDLRVRGSAWVVAAPRDRQGGRTAPAIGLETGSVRVMAEAQPVALTTPSAWVEVNGPGTSVEIDDARRTRVIVHEGKAVVATAAQRLEVPAGHGVVVADSGAMRLLPLPPPPAPDGPARLTRATLSNVLERHVVAWTPVARASRYRVKVTREGASGPLVERELPAGTTRLVVTGLEPGRYRVNAATVDSDGLSSAWGDTGEIAVVPLRAQGVQVRPDGVWAATPGAHVDHDGTIEAALDGRRVTDKTITLLGFGQRSLSLGAAGYSPDVVKIDLSTLRLAASVSPREIRPEGGVVEIALLAHAAGSGLPLRLDGARLVTELGTVAAQPTAEGAKARLVVPPTRQQRRIALNLVLPGTETAQVAGVLTQMPPEASSLTAARVPLHAAATSIDLPAASPLVGRRLRLSSAVRTEDERLLDQRGRIDGSAAFMLASRLGVDIGGSVARVVPPDQATEADIGVSAQAALRGWLYGKPLVTESSGDAVVGSIGFLQGFRDTREGKAPSRLLPALEYGLARGRWAASTSQGAEIELRGGTDAAYRGAFRGAVSLERRVALSASALVRAGTPLGGGGATAGALLGGGVHVGRDSFAVSVTAHVPTDDNAKGWYGAYALTLGLDWFTF